MDSIKDKNKKNKDDGTEQSQQMTNKIDFEASSEAKDRKVTKKSTKNPKNKAKGATQIKFSPDKPIFLQINRQNLFQYFISGLMSPAQYEKNRPQPDMQSEYKDSLLLSNGIINELQNTDALIELNFSDNEKTELVVSGGFLSKPIPVSRIKCVHVQSAEVKDDILASAKSTDGGIIPDSLIVDSFPELGKVALPEKTHRGQGDDYSDRIIKFDRVMGAYSFLKNISLLLTDRTNTYSIIPDHYLGFVKLLLDDDIDPGFGYGNTNDKHINNFYRHLLGIKTRSDNKVLKWLFDRANGTSNLGSKDIVDFGILVLKDHEDSEFHRDAIKALELLDNGIKRKNAPKEIAKLNHKDKVYLYLFSFLYLYGNRTAEDRTNSRVGLPQEVMPQYAEFVFALLGFFYGYTLLRNRDEELKYTDSNINEFASQFDKPAIKFELNCLFDFYLIESIYQFVFNGIESSSVKDINFIDPVIDFPKEVETPKLPENYEFRKGKVYDKHIFKLKKKSQYEILTEKLESFPQKIPVFTEIGLYCLRNHINFEWNLNADIAEQSNIEKLRNIAIVDKVSLLEHIKSGKYNMGNLEGAIDSTNKFS